MRALVRALVGDTTYSALRRVARQMLTVMRWGMYRVRFLGRAVDVHPTAWVAWSARIRAGSGGRISIGRRCEVHPGAMLLGYGGAVRLGDDCSVNPYTILYGHGGLHIGTGVRIAAHTVVIPANHQRGDDVVPGMRKPITKIGIHIGDFTWVGAGVRILDGVRIGRHAVIGAGSVVTRDVADEQVVAGVPARAIGRARADDACE